MAFDPQVRRANLPKDFIVAKSNPNKQPKAVKVLQEIGGHSNDIKIVSTVTKIVKGIFTILKGLVPGVAAFKGIADFTGTAGKGFKALGGVAKPGDIADEAKKLANPNPVKESTATESGLKIASATLGIAIATMTALEIAEMTQILKIANITKQLGKIPVIGKGILPFVPVLNFFEIAQTSVDIALAAIKMKKLDAAIAKKDQKKAMLSSGITDNYAAGRIARLTLKQKSAALAVDALRPAMEKTAVKAEELHKKFSAKKLDMEAASAKISTSKKIVQIFKKIAYFFKHFIPTKIAEAKAKRAAKENQKICDQVEMLGKIHNNWGAKAGKWATIKERIETGKTSDKDKAELDAYRIQKMRNLDVKKISLNFAKKKEIVSISLSTAALVGLIAATVLFFTGIGALVATLTLAALFMLISIASLSNTLYTKYHKPKELAAKDKAILPSLAAA